MLLLYHSHTASGKHRKACSYNDTTLALPPCVPQLSWIPEGMTTCYSKLAPGCRGSSCVPIPAPTRPAIVQLFRLCLVPPEAAQPWDLGYPFCKQGMQYTEVHRPPLLHSRSYQRALHLGLLIAVISEADTGTSSGSLDCISMMRTQIRGKWILGPTTSSLTRC